uniref:Zeta toxin domain-containing protein n=1 Tax=viral metagenome TaxID=1070528 RepID=A0A6C0KV78_9ZZZZ
MAAESNNEIAKRLHALHLNAASQNVSAKNIKTNQHLFTTLNQLQNERVIADLFSDHRELRAQDTPIFAVIVGSPGTGKTTTSRAILQERGMNYDDFYKVSLDTLTESVKPYRNLTRNAYFHLKKGKREINNSNLGVLSGITSSFISAKKSNFKVNKTRRRVFEGITNKAKNEDPTLQSLDELLWKGLTFGVQHQFNILYDTTIGKTGDKIIKEIIPLLAAAPVLYQLLVILVEAPEEQIKQQMGKRHQNFINKMEQEDIHQLPQDSRVGYIRAIPLGIIKFMIEPNQKGFKAIKDYVKSDEFEEKYADKFASVEFIKRENRFSKAIFTGSQSINVKSSNNSKSSKSSKSKSGKRR